MRTLFLLLMLLWLQCTRHNSSAYLPREDRISSILRPPQVTNHSSYIQKRESPGVDFTWKTTSKPKFVTGKMQKVEPILTVYPPDVVYRHGRGRELVLQSYQQPDGLKRVIYYATLPEKSRFMPPVQDYRYTTATFGSYPYHQPVPFTQQRSYNPNNMGKDFVTRVQSTVIDIRPRGDGKKQYHSPSFTIFDANPNYPDLYDRVTILNGGEMLDNKNKYGVLQGYGGNSLVEHVPPLHTHRPIVTPYALTPHLYYNMRPYHSVDMQKLVAVPGLVNNVPNLYTTYTTSNFQNQPPYPTRYNRFPTNRYPISSALAAILEPSQRPAADMPEQPHKFGGLSTTSNSLPSSSLEQSNNPNDNLGPSLFDQSSPVKNPSLHPLSNKNKVSSNPDSHTTGSPFGQKYTEFGTFNTDFSITKPPHFPQGSDWLNNKTSLDISQFEQEDSNNALASNTASNGQDSSSSMPTTSADGSIVLNEGVDMFSNLNNTIIAPYLASFPNTTIFDSQDE